MKSLFPPRKLELKKKSIQILSADAMLLLKGGDNELGAITMIATQCPSASCPTTRISIGGC